MNVLNTMIWNAGNHIEDDTMALRKFKILSQAIESTNKETGEK